MEIDRLNTTDLVNVLISPGGGWITCVDADADPKQLKRAFKQMTSDLMSLPGSKIEQMTNAEFQKMKHWSLVDRSQFVKPRKK